MVPILKVGGCIFVRTLKGISEIIQSIPSVSNNLTGFTRVKNCNELLHLLICILCIIRYNLSEILTKG